MINKEKSNLVYPLIGRKVVIYNKKGEKLNEGIVLEETKYTITLESKTYLKASVWIKLNDMTFPGNIIIAKQHEKIKKLIKKLRIKNKNGS